MDKHEPHVQKRPHPRGDEIQVPSPGLKFYQDTNERADAAFLDKKIKYTE